MLEKKLTVSGVEPLVLFRLVVRVVCLIPEVQDNDLPAEAHGVVSRVVHGPLGQAAQVSLFPAPGFEIFPAICADSLEREEGEINIIKGSALTYHLYSQPLLYFFESRSVKSD